ncbi:hypothetical protein [Psychroserpens ponticola]|uniref:Outer membrane lipoprotein-sorting protein n=1 Tax=Psychroserpens ponticola TaxID=2932268 RepID=A0ABY7RZ93_9FLAO|nr:hypothetical protein [Psychroserpens ponticola]WCO02224.1 hypothetical protein MUN68_001750 [Psychroserpens ponticola]
MTRLLTIICILSILAACKAETKEQSSKPETISEVKKELSSAEKIAQAHGIDNWKNVNEIQFTFNVDRDENHSERTWKWQPKNNYVVSIVSKDSIIMYTRHDKLEPSFVKVDQGFINDKFWLLLPFQLVWDEGTTISESIKEVAPISKIKQNKITLTYGNKGGYTPGDAYDIYFDEDYLIREWVFRKGNSETPSMTNTFENYEEFNGMKIAKDHKMTEGNFNLYFSNIKVK